MNRQRYKKYILKKALITELIKGMCDTLCNIVGVPKKDKYVYHWADIKIMEENGTLLPLNIEEKKK